MAQIIGNVNTNDIDGERIFVDIREDIQELQTEEAPLSVVTREAEDNSTEKPEYKHYESDLRATTVTVTADATDTATTLTLDTDEGNNVHPNMILFVNDTNERMRITSVDRNNDEIDVERALGSSSASAITSPSTLVIMGNAEEEGAGAPEEVNAELTKVNNYTQIFRHPFSVTGTTAATVLEAGDPEFDRLSEQKAKEHVRAIEMAFMFGVKQEDLSGSNPRRTTGGLKEHITTNTLNLSGSALGEQQFENFLADVFQYGSDTKWMFAGAHLMKSINRWAREDLQTKVGEDTFGVRVGQLITTFGVLNIRQHKLLSRHGNPGKGFIVDPDSISRRPLNNNQQNRDNTLRMNIQNPDEDKLKSEYLSELGFEVRNESKCALIEDAGEP